MGGSDVSAPQRPRRHVRGSGSRGSSAPAGVGTGGALRVSSSFGEMADLWLADLELREVTEGTRQTYRDQIRLHVRSAFEHYTLGEITDSAT